MARLDISSITKGLYDRMNPKHHEYNTTLDNLREEALWGKVSSMGEEFQDLFRWLTDEECEYPKAYMIDRFPDIYDGIPEDLATEYSLEASIQRVVGGTSLSNREEAMKEIKNKLLEIYKFESSASIGGHTQQLQTDQPVQPAQSDVDTSGGLGSRIQQEGPTNNGLLEPVVDNTTLADLYNPGEP